MTLTPTIYSIISVLTLVVALGFVFYSNARKTPLSGIAVLFMAVSVLFIIADSTATLKYAKTIISNYTLVSEVTVEKEDGTEETVVKENMYVDNSLGTYFEITENFLGGADKIPLFEGQRVIDRKLGGSNTVKGAAAQFEVVEKEVGYNAPADFRGFCESNNFGSFRYKAKNGDVYGYTFDLEESGGVLLETYNRVKATDAKAIPFAITSNELVLCYSDSKIIAVNTSRNETTILADDYKEFISDCFFTGKMNQIKTNDGYIVEESPAVYTGKLPEEGK